MNQLIYSPLGSLNRLHHELARAFDAPVGEPREWVPSADIHENENGFHVYLDVPGVKASDVEVTLDRTTLSIKGHRTDCVDVEDQARSYQRRERFTGKFLRQFTLPESADANAIKARVNNGVLEVIIPKGETNKPRTITVEA